MAFKAQNEALFKRFTQVRTNGDAWAMGMEATRGALQVAQELAQSTGPEIVDAIGMLQNASADVHRYLAPMSGADDEPVSAASWKDLRGAIGRLYNTWWAIEDVLPPSQRHTAWQAWGAILLDVGASVPEAAKATIDFAGDLASDAIGAGAKAASNVLWQFVKGAWPILLAAGVVLGAGVYLAATGVAVPKVKVST
jgi:predicted trehalose synthase